MDQSLPTIAKRYSGCGLTRLVTTNNYVIMIGGGGSGVGLGSGVFMLRWPREWLNGSGWPSAITTAGTVLQNHLWKHLILWGQDMPTRLHLQRCIFCSRVPSFLMWSLNMIMLSSRNSDTHRWRLNNRSLNTGLLFLISSSVSFGLCVEFVVVTTIREMSD